MLPSWLDQTTRIRDLAPRVALCRLRGDDSLGVLKTGAAGDERLSAEDLFEEFSLVAALAHPCLPRARAFRVEGGEAWALYDYRSGEPLDGTPPPANRSEAECLVLGTLSALASIHAAGRAHRDVSPHNVVVEHLRSFRGCGLIDLAFVRGGGSGLIGTPGYLAPEIVLGGEAGSRSDLYSWATVVVRWLRGLPTAGSTSLREWAIQAGKLSSEDRSRAAEALGPGTAELLERCLAPNPQDRPEDALDALVSLRSAGMAEWGDAVRTVLEATLGTQPGDPSGDGNGSTSVALREPDPGAAPHPWSVSRRVAAAASLRDIWAKGLGEVRLDAGPRSRDDQGDLPLESTCSPAAGGKAVMHTLRWLKFEAGSASALADALGEAPGDPMFRLLHSIVSMVGSGHCIWKSGAWSVLLISDEVIDAGYPGEAVAGWVDGMGARSRRSLAVLAAIACTPLAWTANPECRGALESWVRRSVSARLAQLAARRLEPEEVRRGHRVCGRWRSIRLQPHEATYHHWRSGPPDSIIWKELVQGAVMAGDFRLTVALLKDAQGRWPFGLQDATARERAEAAIVLFDSGLSVAAAEMLEVTSGQIQQAICRLISDDISPRPRTTSQVPLAGNAGASYPAECRWTEFIDHWTAIAARSAEGLRFARIENYAAAESAFRGALGIAESHGLRRWTAACEINIANCMIECGSYDAALPHLERSLRTSYELGDIQFAARAQGTIGRANYQRGLVQDAAQCWQRQANILRSGGTTVDLAVALNWVGCGLEAAGAWQRAAEEYHHAAEVARLRKAPAEGLLAQGNLANLMTLVGEFGAAACCLRRASADLSCHGPAAWPKETRYLEVVQGRLDRETAPFVGERVGAVGSGAKDAPLVPGPRESPFEDEQERLEWELLLLARHRWIGPVPADARMATDSGAEDHYRMVLVAWAAADMGRLTGAVRSSLDVLHGKPVDPAAAKELALIGEILCWCAAEGMNDLDTAVEQLVEIGDACRMPGIEWRARLARCLRRLSSGRTDKAMQDALVVLHVVRRITVGLEEEEKRSFLGRPEIEAFSRALEATHRTLCRGEVCRAQAGDLSGSRLESLVAEVLALVQKRSDVRGGAVDARWQRVLSVTERMNVTRELDSLLEYIVDSVLDICSAENGFVVLLDEAGAASVRVARGLCAANEDLGGAEVSSTLVRQVVEARKGVVVGNVLDDEGLLSQPSVRNLDLRSIICVPMTHKGRLLGVLYVDNRSVAGQFTGSDLEILQLFANQAAVAIENARLFRDLERSYRELADAHERIVRSEKLKVLGEMAGGVAHDFNNLLTAILVRAQLLQQTETGAGTRRELEMIEKAALDGAAVVRRIQDFSRLRRARVQEVFSLRDVTTDAIEFARAWSGARKGSRRVEILAADLEDCQIEGAPAEIREVLTNILLNAVEATEETGGRVEVRSAVEGGRAEVVVRDEGPGIPVEVLDKIFDPFFTTKGEKGNGLGLSVAFGIVTRHGGDIRAGNRLGGGAEFAVNLPAAAGCANSKSERAAPLGGQLRR